MKTRFFFLFFLCSSLAFAQTSFLKTDEKFENGEHIYNVRYQGVVVGEFWPIKAIHLVTKETAPEIFQEEDMVKVHQRLGGIATAPDGMTSASVEGYQMEGMALANGIPCGDGEVKDYGMIVVGKNGYEITFTHQREIDDFDFFYKESIQECRTVFFLPSIYRNGARLFSDNLIDKVLIRRSTPLGLQIGVIVFNQPVSCTQAVDATLGLNRKGASETTHVYVLDGGPSWGQSVKEVNNSPILIGTREPKVVTNYLVFY